MQKANGKPGRIYAFDFMRAYCCLMIVLLHVDSAWKADRVGAAGYYAMGSVRAAFDSAIVALLVRIAVPMFFMISGALFLNPSNDISLPSISRHIRKLLVFLGLFGYVFALMEAVFVNRRLGLSGFGAAFLNLLQEETWAHLWFLYAMIGLYILTPALRAWIQSASLAELRAGAAVCLILLSVIPTINDCTGLDITTFRILSPGGGLLCYLAGYFLSAPSSIFATTPPPPAKMYYQRGDFNGFSNFNRGFWLFGFSTDNALPNLESLPYMDIPARGGNLLFIAAQRMGKPRGKKQMGSKTLPLQLRRLYHPPGVPERPVQGTAFLPGQVSARCRRMPDLGLRVRTGHCFFRAVIKNPGIQEIFVTDTDTGGDAYF